MQSSRRRVVTSSRAFERHRGDASVGAWCRFAAARDVGLGKLCDDDDDDELELELELERDATRRDEATSARRREGDRASVARRGVAVAIGIGVRFENESSGRTEHPRRARAAHV